MCDKFRDALDPEEFSIRAPLRDHQLLIALFKRVLELMGVELTPPARKFSQQPSWYERAYPLQVMDITTIRERIHTVNIVSYVEGILLLQYSDRMAKGDQEQVPSHSHPHPLPLILLPIGPLDAPLRLQEV